MPKGGSKGAPKKRPDAEGNEAKGIENKYGLKCFDCGSKYHLVMHTDCAKKGANKPSKQSQRTERAMQAVIAGRDLDNSEPEEESGEEDQGEANWAWGFFAENVNSSSSEEEEDIRVKTKPLVNGQDKMSSKGDWPSFVFVEGMH